MRDYSIPHIWYYSQVTIPHGFRGRSTFPVWKNEQEAEHDPSRLFRRIGLGHRAMIYVSRRLHSLPPRRGGLGGVVGVMAMFQQLRTVGPCHLAFALHYTVLLKLLSLP